MSQKRKKYEFEGLLWIRVACVQHVLTCGHVIQKRKALRAIPRGKQWLTVYRAPQVTRRAFLSSKSNTAAREIEFQHASQKVGKIDDKNEDFSKSVNSFDF